MLGLSSEESLTDGKMAPHMGEREFFSFVSFSPAMADHNIEMLYDQTGHNVVDHNTAPIDYQESQVAAG